MIDNEEGLAGNGLSNNFVIIGIDNVIDTIVIFTNGKISQY